MIIVNCDEFDGDCMIGMIVSPIAPVVVMMMAIMMMVIIMTVAMITMIVLMIGE